MGKHSKKNCNPNWRAEQAALTEQTKLCRVHDADVTLLRFGDGRLMQRQANGQLVRVYQVKDQLLTKQQMSGRTPAPTKN
jgi:hypothetical protein